MQPPQLIKRNTVVPIHIGLRAVLARCLPLPLSSGEEEEEEEEEEKKEKKVEEEEEA